MDLRTLVQNIDAATARAFVQAGRHVIDALLIEAQRVRAVQTPAPRDYNAAELPRETPAGGWLGHDELKATARELAEALAAERWVDGVLLTIRALSFVGGVL